MTQQNRNIFLFQTVLISECHVFGKNCHNENYLKIISENLQFWAFASFLKTISHITFLFHYSMFQCFILQYRFIVIAHNLHNFNLLFWCCNCFHKMSLIFFWYNFQYLDSVCENSNNCPCLYCFAHNWWRNSLNALLFEESLAIKSVQIRFGSLLTQSSTINLLE